MAASACNCPYSTIAATQRASSLRSTQVTRCDVGHYSHFSMAPAARLSLLLLLLCGDASSRAEQPTRFNRTAAPPTAERPVLLFAYFLASSMSVHLAYSRDGLRFAELNGGRPVLCARRGNWTTIRDPYLHRAPDGETFHLVASAGNFGFADCFHYWNLTLASGSPVFSGGTTSHRRLCH